MNSKFLFIFLFIFLICFGSSATLSMSPPQIDFVGQTGETICEKVYFKIEEKDILIGKANWAKEGFDERKLSKHQLTSEEIGLEVIMPELITIDNCSEIEVCIKGSKKGNYHGALLYRIKDKPLQVGIWMNVSLKGNSIQKITGNFIKTEGKRGNMGVYFAVMLFLILGGLLVWNWKRRNR